jgi:hypothetical protein
VKFLIDYLRKGVQPAEIMIHSQHHHSVQRRDARLGEWWPAALVGLALLLGINPPARAEPEISVASDDVLAKRFRLADFVFPGSLPPAVGPLSGN